MSWRFSVVLPRAYCYLSSNLHDFQMVENSTTLKASVFSHPKHKHGNTVSQLAGSSFEIPHVWLSSGFPLGTLWDKGPLHFRFQETQLYFALCMDALLTDHMGLVPDEQGKFSWVFGCPIAQCLDSRLLCEFIPGQFSLHRAVVLNWHHSLRRHPSKTLYRARIKPTK